MPAQDGSTVTRSFRTAEKIGHKANKISQASRRKISGQKFFKSETFILLAGTLILTAGAFYGPKIVGRLFR